MKENSNILFSVHKFYKIKTIFHWVSFLSFLLGVILTIVSVTAFVTTVKNDFETDYSSGTYAVIVITGISTFLYVMGASFVFINAILGIFGYMKMGSLPLVAEGESIVENNELKSKGLLSLIGGFVFSPLSMIMDHQITKTTKHAIKS